MLEKLYLENWTSSKNAILNIRTRQELCPSALNYMDKHCFWKTEKFEQHYYVNSLSRWTEKIQKARCPENLRRSVHCYKDICDSI